MKTLTNLKKISFFVAVLTCSSLFFQSCAKVDDVKPITQSNSVTIKVIDNDYGTSSISAKSSKHFRIVTTGATQEVLLDTDITGNYTYTFTSKTPNISIKATITSSSDFINAIEVDANGKMHAYHNGSCAGTQFETTDSINF